MQRSSRDFLQSQVAISTAVGAAVVAMISFVRRVLFFGAIDGNLLVSFLHPAVSLVLLIGAAVAFTAAFSGAIGRIAQVAVLMITACAAATQAPSGDLTSSVFFGLGILLAGEYNLLSGRRIGVFGGLAVVFVASLGYGSYKMTGATLTVGHTLVGTGLIAFLFIAVVRTRLREVAQRELDLEEMVKDRTKKLQGEVDRRAALEQNLRDTAERSSKLAKDRALLLHELHHRTKNDLQLVSSLLRLHGENPDVADTAFILQSAEDRITTIALVHEYLYGSETLADIDLQEYLEGLLYHLQSSRSDRDITIHRHLQSELVVGLEPAVHIGLVVNELVLNALKHAFPGKRSGNIEVTLLDKTESIVLLVSDDGIGLPPDWSLDNTKQVGIQIVNALVAQLAGSISFEREPTTTWEIEIPIDGLGTATAE